MAAAVKQLKRKARDGQWLVKLKHLASAGWSGATAREGGGGAAGMVKQVCGKRVGHLLEKLLLVTLNLRLEDLST